MISFKVNFRLTTLQMNEANTFHNKIIVPRPKANSISTMVLYCSANKTKIERDFFVKTTFRNTRQVRINNVTFHGTAQK
jgi:hypothetical protein